MAQAAVTPNASPERWQKAVKRAVDEQITVSQVNVNGMWVANSGTRPGVAYMLDVREGFVLSCTCEAGQFGDPCCKHRAAFYLATGQLDGPDDDGASALVAA